ncbi:hypothetical protein T05_15944 [Trichinella murrelli]|uniref:Uncharacterized protein n=1 Tax=Trichinella murrelli TaxID=144512 RepID=A0A0V0TCK1_9BILA|nr:hypothetical protein T05_15944 [Trichinella murrelli]
MTLRFTTLNTDPISVGYKSFVRRHCSLPWISESTCSSRQRSDLEPWKTGADLAYADAVLSDFLDVI